MIKIKGNEEFFSIIREFTNNDTVKQMRKYIQHGNVTTYAHCVSVAYVCYKICKKMKWDYVAVTRAAMVHDLFLYDWHEKRPCKRFRDLHAFKHPKDALKNAEKMFKFNKKERNIILNHMWPVTPRLPRYKEAYVITIADKLCAIKETFIRK